MITGDPKCKIDRIWDAFWSGGISNPLEVIDQITHLPVVCRLDEAQTLAEKAPATGETIENEVLEADENLVASLQFRALRREWPA